MPKKVISYKDLEVFDKFQPESKWSFYESFHNSLETQLAQRDHKSSIDKKNTQHYLNEAYQQRYQEHIVKVNQTILPDYLQNLLNLANTYGKWMNLKEVLICIGLPVTINLFIGLEWEQATALALIFMRQNVEYFNELQAMHDIGLNNLNVYGSCNISLLLQRAKDLIFKVITAMKQRQPYDDVIAYYSDGNNFIQLAELSLHPASHNNDHKVVISMENARRKSLENQMIRRKSLEHLRIDAEVKAMENHDGSIEDGSYDSDEGSVNVSLETTATPSTNYSHVHQHAHHGPHHFVSQTSHLSSNESQQSTHRSIESGDNHPHSITRRDSLGRRNRQGSITSHSSSTTAITASSTIATFVSQDTEGTENELNAEMTKWQSANQTLNNYELSCPSNYFIAENTYAVTIKNLKTMELPDYMIRAAQTNSPIIDKQLQITINERKLQEKQKQQQLINSHISKLEKKLMSIQVCTILIENKKSNHNDVCCMCVFI